MNAELQEFTVNSRRTPQSIHVTVAAEGQSFNIPQIQRYSTLTGSRRQVGSFGLRCFFLANVLSAGAS
jgi:hypothetical protein